MPRKEEHILACLSSAPSNAKIIRTAARMAEAFQGHFTALFVDTPGFAQETEENKLRLLENRQLAQELGADIAIVNGDDVAFQIAEFARISGITKIVLGQSAAARKSLFGKPSLTEQIIAQVTDIDIHIIPDKKVEVRSLPEKKTKNSVKAEVKNCVMTIGILAGATLLSNLFYRFGFTDANIIMVYILGVLLTSVATSHLAYSLVSSIASVFIFNYFFTSPRFTLMAYATGYPVTFIVMFLTAFITGTFAIRYKAQARQAAKHAYRTKILFDTDQLLSKAKNKEEILKTMADQIVKLLGRNIVLFDIENDKLKEPQMISAANHDAMPFSIEKELETAEWVLKNNHSAGATTDTLSEAHYFYLTLRVNDRIYGVVGIEAWKNPLDVAEHSILLAILGECALALENEKNAREKEEAAIRAKNEQLRANLLRSISHDFRTPLTSISGHASNLLRNGENFEEDIKKRLYEDIYDESVWLINLVENLLASTRIEDGAMLLRKTTELISDIVEEALKHIRNYGNNHKIRVVDKSEFMLVDADVRLIVQVIINIVDNALKYTPKGSDITVIMKRSDKDDMAEVIVADNGPGITEEEKASIFEKFYRGSTKVADSRRSMGLGLYLCKAIVEAHGGRICVEDNVPAGTIFRFTLPLKEVELHE